MTQGIEAMAPASQMERPRQSDELVVREAAQKLAVDCAEWCGQSTPEEWVEDLIKCRYYWSDGYKLAKALESRCHVDPDSDLVEVLGSASSYLYDAHKAATKKWVQIVGFTPLYEVGQVVSCRHGEGPIHEIYVETAEYVIDTDRRGNGGFIVAAENVAPAVAGGLA